jgi:quinol monooxygenase YgiN
MTVIEILRFRLIEGADESAFLVADKSVQEEFAYQQSGLLRRTTARSDDGEWVVIEIWESAEAADAGAVNRDADPSVAVLKTFVDAATLSQVRYRERS